jgi:hypothetical protein
MKGSTVGYLAEVMFDEHEMESNPSITLMLEIVKIIIIKVVPVFK